MRNSQPSRGELATEARYRLMHLASQMSDVVGLGAGDPDLHTPATIIQETMARIRDMALPSSEAPHGLLELRRAISSRLRRERNLDLDPDRQILITNGAQEGLFLSMLALVDEGRSVLLQDPRYSSYDQAIEAAGGQLLEIPPLGRHDFCLDLEALKQNAAPGRILVFVNPNNPTGALHSPDMVARIAEVVRTHEMTVVSDDVYDGLVFDDAPVRSIAECDEMEDRTILLSSFSKTYAMTGFRVGYLAGPSHFIEAACRLKQKISGPCALFSQVAALAALSGSQSSRREILKIFQGRRKVMLEGLDKLGIPYGHPGGGFFIWADISRYGMPSHDFCLELLQKGRVLLFPGTAFGNRWGDFVRISILQAESRLQDAVERIGAFTAGRSAHDRT